MRSRCNGGQVSVPSRVVVGAVIAHSLCGDSLVWCVVAMGLLPTVLVAAHRLRDVTVIACLSSNSRVTEVGRIELLPTSLSSNSLLSRGRSYCLLLEQQLTAVAVRLFVPAVRDAYTLNYLLGLQNPGS